MCRRACNICIGLYWAMTKYGGQPDFELALNRIESHSVECHFGLTRSRLKGDTQWKQFFAAQIMAVMRRLHFPPYIRRFAMPAGCVVQTDTEKSIHLNFGNIMDGIREMTYHLSQNRPQAAFEVGCPLMEKLFDSPRALIEGKFCERSHESIPWSVMVLRPDGLVQPTENWHLRKRGIFTTSRASKYHVNSTPRLLSR
jgi:hypothetical protein